MLRDSNAMKPVQGEVTAPLHPQLPEGAREAAPVPAKDESDPVSAGNIARMKEINARMKDRSRRDVADAAELGELLIPAKKAVSHGEWELWLEENVSCSAGHARACIRIAKAKALGLIKAGMTFQEALEAFRKHEGKKAKKGKNPPKPPKAKRLNLEQVQTLMTQIVPQDEDANVLDVQATKVGDLERLGVAAIRKAKSSFGKGTVIVSLRLVAE